VQTICLGLSSEETEELVTVPLEQALNGVAQLDEIRSDSVPQLSSVELIFKRGTDLIQAASRSRSAWRPSCRRCRPWAAPPVMRQPISTTSRVMHIGMSSQTSRREALDDRLLEGPRAPAPRAPAW
jgi:Cu/Ag efflux pump CusA